MAESILDTLMTTLTEAEMTDNGQSLDLFNINREKEIRDFVASLLKEGVPIPEIEFNADFVSKHGGGRAVALYDLETKKIYLDESTSINDKHFKDFVSHEVLHYVDDFSVPDIEGQWLSRSDQPNEFINPEIRKEMTAYGMGKKEPLENYPGISTYKTPDWAYDFGETISDPAEHLAYYSESYRGDFPAAVAENAALRSLDEWQPLVEHETIVPGKWPWSKPDTMRSWTGDIEPQYDVHELVQFTQDRGAILDVLDELTDEYFSDEGKGEYYFDPSGSGYDYARAFELGYKRSDDPSGAGHLPSIDNETGMVLKGRGNKKEWDLMVKEEESLGNIIVKGSTLMGPKGARSEKYMPDRWYSVKKPEDLSKEDIFQRYPDLFKVLYK